jgi:aryl-alcohol dehydrogenase-like predicted oxidoreductase
MRPWKYYLPPVEVNAMRYSQFGDSGLIVSKLAFGAMTFGEGVLVGELVNKVDQYLADRMVHACLDAGVNLFDTADMYTSGQSEIMLGKALKGKRQDVLIATKCGFRSGDSILSAGLSYRYLLQSIENSLKRLDTDYIDLFFLHIPDPWTPLEETARALEAAVQKGWIRYPAFSNYPAWKAQRLIDLQHQRHFTPMAGAQMYYSMLARDLDGDYKDFITANGLGLMAWSPLASGFLSGKYSKENPLPQDSRRVKFDFPPVDIDKGYKVIEALRTMADKHQASIAQVALAWVMQQSFVSSVLIGATKLEQLDDNLKSAQLTLDQEDLRTIEELTAIQPPYPAWMQPMGIDMLTSEALKQ